jgi:hypothetical protein
MQPAESESLSHIQSSYGLTSANIEGAKINDHQNKKQISSI